MNKREVSNANLPSARNQIPTSAHHRIFVCPENISKERIILGGEPLKKVRRVLRLKPNDPLCVFDGTGVEYLTRIVSLSSKEGELKVLKKTNPRRESSLETHVAQAVPKSNKMDLIIQKAVELGASEIHPFFSSRSIPRFSRGQAIKKVERWQKISQEASQQSGRTRIPRVNPPVDFIEFLTALPHNGLKIILQKDFSPAGSLKNLLVTSDTKPGIFFVVGPEGGFSPKEITLARDHGFKPISLGERILRTETVALTFLSILQYELGDINIDRRYP